MRTRRSFGLSGITRHPPFLTPGEAQFIIKQRKKGFSDQQIALQLGCSVGLVTRGSVLSAANDEHLKANDDTKPYNGRLVPLSAEERRLRDKKARAVERWTPDNDQ